MQFITFYYGTALHDALMLSRHAIVINEDLCVLMKQFWISTLCFPFSILCTKRLSDRGREKKFYTGFGVIDRGDNRDVLQTVGRSH